MVLGVETSGESLFSEVSGNNEFGLFFGDQGLVLLELLGLLSVLGVDLLLELFTLLSVLDLLLVSSPVDGEFEHVCAGTLLLYQIWKTIRNSDQKERENCPLT